LKKLQIVIIGHPSDIAIDPGSHSIHQVQQAITGLLPGAFVNFGSRRETGEPLVSIGGINDPMLAIQAIGEAFPVFA
jgi:hypothetical protein